MALVRPSVCLSVTLVIHALTVEHIEMPFASYDRVMLDTRFLCGSWASCYICGLLNYLCVIFVFAPWNSFRPMKLRLETSLSGHVYGWVHNANCGQNIRKAV